MNLPTPYRLDRETGKANEALETYNRRLSRSFLPLGVGKRYKAKLWCKRPRNYRQARKSKGAVFTMEGDCIGTLGAILGLGQKLAREAMAAGDTEWATRAMRRMEHIVYEHELAHLTALEAELERATA